MIESMTIQEFLDVLSSKERYRAEEEPRPWPAPWAMPWDRWCPI